MSSISRPKVGLISVYFGLFDEAMPAGFRADRASHPVKLRSLLEDAADVCFPGLVDSDASGTKAGRALADERVDVVVCAPSMAAPPSYTWAALEQVPQVPVVVVAAQDSGEVPDDYTTEVATQRSLPVGLAMLTNVLVRHDRPFGTVVGVLTDEAFAERLHEAVQVAFAVATIQGGRLLSVGDPISGYLDVMASESDLASLGVSTVPVSARELTEAFAGVAESDVAEFLKVARSEYDTSGVSSDVLERSARLTCALRGLCEQKGVVGGAVNCHGDVLRWNDGVGITACLAVSELSAEGRPFACTGDIPTAIALAVGKTIAGSALYCELYQLDVPGDWLLVANGGEGDLDSRDLARPVRLLPEDHYMGAHGPGTAVAFSLPAGPSTLVSFSPMEKARGGWRFVAAEGFITDSRHEAMEGPNGMFRFAEREVEDGFARWCEAGATHHAVVLPGHREATLVKVGELLGVEVVAV